jgi:hypothetical protein
LAVDLLLVSSPQPIFKTPIEEILYDLHKALKANDVAGIIDAIILSVPRLSNPQGILRQDYIKNEIRQKYGEYGYGDLRSDVMDLKYPDATLKDLLTAVLSDKLDFESQVRYGLDVPRPHPKGPPHRGPFRQTRLRVPGFCSTVGTIFLIFFCTILIRIVVYV